MDDEAEDCTSVDWCRLRILLTTTFAEDYAQAHVVQRQVAHRMRLGRMHKEALKATCRA